jgi:hypothetical protein
MFGYELIMAVFMKTLYVCSFRPSMTVFTGFNRPVEHDHIIAFLTVSGGFNLNLTNLYTSYRLHGIIGGFNIYILKYFCGICFNLCYIHKSIVLTLLACINRSVRSLATSFYLLTVTYTYFKTHLCKHHV